MANENDTTEFGFRNGNVKVSQLGDADVLLIESKNEFAEIRIQEDGSICLPRHGAKDDPE